MGFSGSWIAVKDLAPATVMAELGLEVVSEGHEHPEGKFSLAQLPNGWTVVWFDRDLDAAFKTPAVNLARHGPAVAAGIEEHVMFAEARGYVDGREAWRVTRNSEADEDLETTGDVPPAYAALRDAAVARQGEDGNEDVDLLFDVPLDLDESICGYRHDVMRTDGATFLELRRAKRKAGDASKPGFFARLFGAR